MLLTLDEALAQVAGLAALLPQPQDVQTVPLLKATGRVLAADVCADRDQPPFHRSTRDGFAVRSEDVQGPGPVVLSCLGELPAGKMFSQPVGQGQCVEIMTGAPLPSGTDAVVMVEYARWVNKEPVDSVGHVELSREAHAGDNVVPCGAEAHKGDVVLAAGRRLDAAAIALLASVGQVQVKVFSLPRVSVLTTGDEVVSAEQSPALHQIRNSNEFLLASAIERSGGEPLLHPPAADDLPSLKTALAGALKSDLVVLTGGVSKGKHDHVKEALASLGAQIVFAGVAIRPGKPVVLAHVKYEGRLVPVLGLPGNPLSAFVTFALFGRPLLSRLSGDGQVALRFMYLPLARAFAWRPLEFTAFVPGTISGESGQTVVTLMGSQGSGDLVAAASADVFACIPPHSAGPLVGHSVALLLKP
jgi:molybdopterin molybdotransferase